MCPQNMGIITKKKKLLLLATSMSILAKLKRKSKAFMLDTWLDYEA